jgi:hypothetical protein
MTISSVVDPHWFQCGSGLVSMRIRIRFKQTYVGDSKALLKDWKSGVIVNFGQFPCSRIGIANADSDPGQINADPDP